MWQNLFRIFDRNWNHVRSIYSSRLFPGCDPQAVTLPLIDKGELPIHGVARYELGGLDLDLSIERGSWVGVDSPHCHQAAEVRAVLLVGLALPFCPQLTGGPAAHVAGAVDCAVLLRLCVWGMSNQPSCFLTPLYTLNNMATPSHEWKPHLAKQAHQLSNKYHKMNTYKF